AAVPGRANHARPRRGAGLRTGARARAGRGAGVGGDARGGPARGGRGQRARGPRGAGEDVHDPAARPLAADGRAHADAEGEAKRGEREVRPGSGEAVFVDSLVSRGVASNDPTDTGGLFIGRRPGTRPVRLPAGVKPSEGARRSADKTFAGFLLLLETLLCMSVWGPQPLFWLWAGSQVDYLSGSVSVGILAAFIGMLITLF